MTVLLPITGHRFMPRGSAIWAREQLSEFFHRAYSKYGKELEIISGMALGVDTWWAQLALENKVPLHAYIPSRTQTGWFKLSNGQWDSVGNRAWPEADRDRWQDYLNQAVEVVDCSQNFLHVIWQTAGALMQHRNREMVNQGQLLGAVWMGTRGGTANCLQYAVSLKKTIYWIDPVSHHSSWRTPPTDKRGRLVFRHITHNPVQNQISSTIKNETVE